MKEIGLCLVYASCLFTIYNSVIMPLVSRVNKLEADLWNMRSELKEIKSQFFMEGETDDRREI